MKKVVGAVKKFLGKNKEKRFFTQISKYYNYFWGTTKLLIALFSSSFFLIVSAFYTFAFGFSKETYFIGRKESNGDIAKERKYYLRMCMTLALSAIIYIVYMARSFYFPMNHNYGMLFGISYAFFAFVDLTLAILGLARNNKKRDLLVSGIKSIALAGAFYALSFAQIVILGFAYDGDPSVYNAITGVAFGAGCLMICVFMLAKYFKTAKAGAAAVAIDITQEEDAAGHVAIIEAVAE